MKVSKHVIELAKVQARKSVLRHRHGAVLLDSKGKVINTGYNHSVFSSEIPNRRSHCIHAEQAALTGLRGQRVRGCSIVVVRVNAKDELLLSRPCKRCWNLLTRKGVQCVVYSTSAADITFERL